MTIALSLIALSLSAALAAPCDDAIDPTWRVPPPSAVVQDTVRGEPFYAPVLLASIELAGDHEIRFSEAGHGLIVVEELHAIDPVFTSADVGQDATVLWEIASGGLPLPADLEAAILRSEALAAALAGVDTTACEEEPLEPEEDFVLGPAPEDPPDPGPCDEGWFWDTFRDLPFLVTNQLNAISKKKLDELVAASAICPVSGKVQHKIRVQPWWTWKTHINRQVPAGKLDHVMFSSSAWDGIGDFDVRITATPVALPTVFHMASGNP